jgi:hypothetical protein
MSKQNRRKDMPFEDFGTGSDVGQSGSTQREGSVARSIEKQTSKLPSDVFLWAGVGSIAVSLGFALAGKQKVANFVGQWTPTFLLLGVYNKLVKLGGHDRYDRDLD